MNYNMNDIEQRYWSIGEVAENLQVATSKIRFWETAFGLEVKRKSAHIRQFVRSDLETLSHIKILLQERKFTIAGAKQELKLRGKDKT
jgi:DNA-binding transcriptional MerR regulator